MGSQRFVVGLEAGDAVTDREARRHLAEIRLELRGEIGARAGRDESVRLAGADDVARLVGPELPVAGGDAAARPPHGRTLDFPRDMDPVDYLLMRGEHVPRGRSAMLSAALLDVVPDFERLGLAFERASRVVLRLRQRVVVPALPLGSPKWIVDPDF